MRKIETIVKIVLILWFIFAMYFQHDLGLADNGDFSRSMKWITSGPVGMETNRPARGTEEWSRRFNDYWIPFWKMEWNTTIRPKSSVYLLWLPGVLLNRFLYSDKVLYLSALSLFPKLILFVVFLLLLKWIEFNPRYRIILLVGLGLPITLMVTTTDYVAYLNSFYQESASLVFLLLFFVSALFLKRRPSLANLLCTLVSTLLLAASKPANLYWSLLVIPFVVYLWPFKKNIKLPTAIIASLALITLFTYISVFITKAGSIQTNPYHSLFYGVLTFSSDPSMHLQELKMNDAAQCVNTSAFSPVGRTCITRYQDRLSFLNTARVIYREPVVIFRMLTYVLDNMQDVSLDYLGKYSFDDPRSKTSQPVHDGVETRFWLPISGAIPLRLWAELKFRYFPTGHTLALTLAGFVIWFFMGLRSTGTHQDLAFVGLILTFACIIDMMVVILGDGKYELIKHLFLSNLLFDIAVIVFLNDVLLYCLELVDKMLPSSHKPVMD